jgi:hypothetical protein
MWHSGRKSQRKQSAIVLASMRSFFFLAAAATSDDRPYRDMLSLSWCEQVRSAQ